MKRTKSALPVNSADPRLIALLIRASTQELRISFTSKTRAWKFRQRLYDLRIAMKREQHPSWEIAYRSVLTVEDSEAGFAVLLKPRDAEFASELDKALGEASSGASSSEASADEVGEAISADFLSELAKAQEEDPPDEMG